MNEKVQSTGGITVTQEKRYCLNESLSHYHVAHHKLHMDSLGLNPGLGD
jgi:hypothetical protein